VLKQEDIMRSQCCTIVPDSRLWTPSEVTLNLLEQEDFTSSIVFEEWLELCCQRHHIIPPSYTRMVMISEYLRISSGSRDYLKHIQNSAILPFEQQIPSSSNTNCLQNDLYTIDLESFFSSNPKHWLEADVGAIKKLSWGVDYSLSMVFLSAFALGSPYQDFTKDSWRAYNIAEMRLLQGSQNLYRKVHGFWPSHPLYDYNIRAFGRMRCPGNTIEERRQEWINDLYRVMAAPGELGPHNRSTINSALTLQRLAKYSIA